MKQRRFKEHHFVIIAISFFLVIGVWGCSSIQFVAPYDQKIDDGVTNLQKMTAEFLTKIERQGGSQPEDYKNHTKFYDDARVALSSILVRASAVSDNTLTIQQLEILREQFRQMEQDDQEVGIPQAAVPQLEIAFNRTFTAILSLEIAKKQPKSEGVGK
jgi:hypothetical protein